MKQPLMKALKKIGPSYWKTSDRIWWIIEFSIASWALCAAFFYSKP